ncbi:carboxypeptidase Y [Ascosphaera apis ARSEF 7405]|uniref:Carboxypeptidase n=1 Tax=Ascosphaera apis ARSEF 7405 TaxID=392613 RepID=A0A167W0Q0_9EURO|nr:carboxypeptidase Y [Ascosphaera apis ARSEF 7405]
MRSFNAALLVGAQLASAVAPPPQQVLGAASAPEDVVSQDGPQGPFGGLNSMFESARKHLTAFEWDSVKDSVFEKTQTFFEPLAGKKHTRRPDSHWDHVLKGADLQGLWVQGDNGQKHRELDGKLDTYDLRVKKVDPSVLGIDPGVKQYSGYLDDNENDKHLFYWFFESRNDPENDPVVLWLNGGPGCSSLTGLFMELGPSSIDKNLKPTFNPSSWNSNASVIFLDQPVNVGFSYSGSSVSDTVAAGKDIYALLTLFFKQFPEYAKQDFHIAGESYAGHYIPVFSSEILSHKNRNINLKSILIGNGLTDPLTQYPEYRPMACGEGGYPAVLDKSTCDGMDSSLPRCLSLIESCYRSESVWTCVPASIYCNNAILGPYQRSGRNPYDVRIDCDGGNLCYPAMDNIAKYLNQAEVKDAVGAEVDNFDSCNMGINQGFLFHGDWMQPFHRLIPGILEQIPVLIYAGDADFICNWLGNKAWADALEWPGHKEYAAAELQPLNAVGYKAEKEEIGQVKSSGNFTFMRLYGGGHMVPMDQPEASLEFFNRWLGGEWWSS